MKLAQLFIALTIILSPLYIWRSYVIVPGINFYLPFTFLEILIALSLTVTSGEFILGRYPLKDLRTSMDLYIGLFVLTALAALPTSYDLIGGLGIFKAYILEPVLFYYAASFVAKKTGYEFIIQALLGSSLWLIGLGFLQKFLNIGVYAPIEQEQHRITAVYNSANSLALYLGPLAILIFSKFFSKSKNYPIKYLYLGFFILIMIVFYYTRSRGGLISMAGALSVFTFAVITLKSKLVRKYWLLVPATAAIFLLTFFIYMYNNYDFFQVDYNRPYTEGDTLQIRYFIWGGTINLLKDHFLFGAGLNGFKTLYSNQYRPVQYQEQFQYPHNILLTFWTEMGIFGLFSFLLILVNLYSILIRNLAYSQTPILGAAFLAILSYWILHGMVDVPYFKNDLSLAFWVFAVLIEQWRLRG